NRADQVPAWLEDQGRIELVGNLAERSRVSAEVGRRPAVVGNAQAAAGVEVTERDPCLRQLAPELGGTFARDEHGLEVEEMRADVKRDADRLERVVHIRSAERLRGLVALEPELAPRPACGQVLVAAAFASRGQPDGNGRGSAER